MLKPLLSKIKFVISSPFIIFPKQIIPIEPLPKSSSGIFKVHPFPFKIKLLQLAIKGFWHPPVNVPTIDEQNLLSIYLDLSFTVLSAII